MSLLNRISIAKRLFLIIILFTLSLAGISSYFLSLYRTGLVDSDKARLQHIVQNSEEAIRYFYDLAQKDASINEAQAKELAKGAIREMRYGNNDYIFIYDETGINLVTGPNPSLEGQNLIDLKDRNGVRLIADLISNAKKGNGEYVHYYWPRGSSEETFPKLSYSAFFEPWGWMVGTGVYIDDIDKKFNAALMKLLAIGAGILVVTGAISVAISLSISRPLSFLTESMEKLANHDFNFTVKYTAFKDEIGKLANALSVFRENAQEVDRLQKEQKEAEERQAEERKRAMNKMADMFEEKVGAIVETVGKAAEDIKAMSQQMAAGAEETSQQSAAVASASEQASSNVQTVAAAAEELSAAIREISQNVTDTASAAQESSGTANQSKEKLDELQTAVDQIDGVLQAILEVAEQTNLLALNATIEAARAGEAGKGFAVVASEVKSLANKTHSMTEEISQLIESIKLRSKETITSVDGIITKIASVNDKTTNIAAAIEEQNNSTLEISRNIQEAAQGTSEVSSSVVGIQQAATESADATTNLLDNAEKLADQSRDLSEAVASFIEEVRSA